MLACARSQEDKHDSPRCSHVAREASCSCKSGLEAAPTLWAVLAWTNNGSRERQKKPDYWQVEPSVGEVGIGVTEEDPCQDLNQRAAAMPCGLGVERELSISLSHA